MFIISEIWPIMTGKAEWDVSVLAAVFFMGGSQYTEKWLSKTGAKRTGARENLQGFAPSDKPPSTRSYLPPEGLTSFKLVARSLEARTHPE